MHKIKHSANSRGLANHGWLKSSHSFSFANYYNAERMNFGALRVLNDDVVQPKMGFGTHPHQNMEIISIPLKGTLSHKDSMNNIRSLEVNEVQVMSAGTGIYHSEFNNDSENDVKLFQIWLFPRERKRNASALPWQSSGSRTTRTCMHRRFFADDVLALLIVTFLDGSIENDAT